MTTTLLIISLILVTYLCLYSLVFVYLTIRIWFSKKETPVANSSNRATISILIPAHNEGDGVIDTVNTVVNQDYEGEIKIYILAKDSSENFISPLTEHYKYEDDGSHSNVLHLLKVQNREVSIILTGHIHKKDKINSVTQGIDSEYTGLLDADHRVAENWVSSSLTKLSEEQTNAVQSRREPLHVSSIFQIWDSVQNHIGNEVLNFVLSKKGHSVFFTGTTCIFKTNTFKNYNFANNLTEDTYLSYDLICDGEKISYNNNSSSYEEVSFDAKSYLFRKRRWSAGHTKVFFDHFRKIAKSKISFSEKIKLVIHGQFFLLPVITALLLSVYGIYFYLQFTENIQWLIILLTTLLSLGISTYFRKKGNNFIVDVIVSFFWIFPQISILAIWSYKILDNEIFYFILSFPYATTLSLVHIYLIFIPFIMIIAGLIFFKEFKWSRVLLMIPSYIFILFFDIYSYLLGFSDLILKKYNWVEIKRQNFVSAENVPYSIRSKMSTGKIIKKSYKRISWVFVGLVVLIISNDLLAFGNCGDTRAFLWQPILIKPNSPITLNVNIDRSINDNNSLDILVSSDFSSPIAADIRGYLDDEPIPNEYVSTNQSGNKIRLNFPLGWDSHEIHLSYKMDDMACDRTIKFATSLIEIRDNSLYVNGEIFLIKGIVPSFSNKLTNLSMDSGLEQIKDSGANTIRFYHAAGEEIKNNAAKYNLMVINQTNRSTWSEFNINNKYSHNLYETRYKKMVEDNEGYPYLLFNTLGNEWELGTNSSINVVPKTKDLITKILASSTDTGISSYSTYLTFVNYPVDVVGINMLDTGRTYWDGALNTLKSMDKTFYASELGGFVAFWETVPDDLRIVRFMNDWNAVLDNGGLGAVYFESHDNWAQPVVNGYNDPFKPEQPDDQRGLWDKDNNAKLDLRFLSEIYSDFDITITDSLVYPSTEQISLNITNKRPYTLNDVYLKSGENNTHLEEFKPFESKTAELQIGESDILNSNLQLTFNYTTHSGFKEISSNFLPLPVLGTKPKITNTDYVHYESSPDHLKGRMLYSKNIELIVPASWSAFELSGKQFSKTSDKMEFPILNPYQDVLELQYSSDGVTWKPFDPSKIGRGKLYLRFRLPEIVNSTKYLILSGLGTGNVEMHYGNNIKNISTFGYRENIIDLNLFEQELFDNYIVLEFDRSHTTYITKEDSPSDNEVIINIEKPVIFSPTDIEINKLY